MAERTHFKEIKIPVAHLKTGMHVVRLDRPWLESKAALQGFFVKSNYQISRLQEECRHVYIEARSNSNEGRIFDISRKAEQGLAEKLDRVVRNKSHHKVVYTNSTSAEKEFTRARSLFHTARDLAKHIMSDMRIGRMLDMNQAKEIVGDSVESILRNSDALTWLTQIKNKDEYTAEHSMNVCILSAGFARYLGLKKEDIKTVGLCGLLHDVGKSQIPLEVLNKPHRLNPDEFKTMSNHTILGNDLLLSASNPIQIAAEVAHSHHERENGSGYPRGIRSSITHFFTEIVTFADVYDGITTHRC